MSPRKALQVKVVVVVVVVGDGVMKRFVGVVVRKQRWLLRLVGLRGEVCMSLGLCLRSVLALGDNRQAIAGTTFGKFFFVFPQKTK